MKFSEKLKSLRIKNELSQEQLANMLNVSRQAVSKWESQNGMPDIENLKSIANIFDVTIDSLVYEGEEIETTDESFCFNIAYIFGGIGFVLAFIFKDVLPNSWYLGVGLGIIGYLVGSLILIIKGKQVPNK